jgi:hypothetical protein
MHRARTEIGKKQERLILEKVVPPREHIEQKKERFFIRQQSKTLCSKNALLRIILLGSICRADK